MSDPAPTKLNPTTGAPPEPVRQGKIVSSEQDLLICVDAADLSTGSESKANCHDGDGIRHRAFSIFVINANGEVLLQQRAASKRLWPNFWSNTCCSHPRWGETVDFAVTRRLQEEMGVNTELDFLYKFEYSARYLDLGSEHEVCHVYLGQTNVDPTHNPTEVSAWRWLPAAQLTQALAADPDQYTPWLHLEWSRLNAEFSERLPQT